MNLLPRKRWRKCKKNGETNQLTEPALCLRLALMNHDSEESQFPQQSWDLHHPAVPPVG